MSGSHGDCKRWVLAGMQLFVKVQYVAFGKEI